jgi:hypothetical protein
MTTLRRILLTTSLAVAASSVASASPIIGFLSSPTTQGPTNTDFSYSLSLPKFDPGTDGIPLGSTLTGATIYFYAQENISTLTLTNTASGVETFTYVATSNVTSLSSNSANNADKYATETLGLFSSGLITLGGNAMPACSPVNAPSSGCSSVTYAPPGITVNNLGVAATGTGVDHLTGVTKSISGVDLANYIGATNFTLGGSTKSLTSFAGGGGNIALAQNTTAEFSAEIDYSYTVPAPPPSTPEPATMGMMGSGFLGLSWLLRRRRKQVKS